MNPNLVGYVISYYRHLMVGTEKRAYSHLVGTMKSTMGRSDLVAQQEARNDNRFSRYLSDDPAWLELASEGYQAFVERTASRILTEHAKDVFLNLCPRCGELT